MRFISILAICAVLLSACSTTEPERLDNTRDMTPPVGLPDYQTALFNHYKMLSQDRQSKRYYADADFFAAKARQAAYEVKMHPDTPYAHVISHSMDESIIAHQGVTKALIHDADVIAPFQMARAVSHYDCWLHELTEDQQAEHAAYCRNIVLDALDQVYLALGTAEQKETTPPTPVITDTSHIIFFRYDSAQLGDGAAEVIDVIAQKLRDTPAYTAYLYGHADQSGQAKYNQKLSERRTNIVAAALVGLGIHPNRIQTKALGETQPMIKPANGKELRNRRVEVILSAE